MYISNVGLIFWFIIFNCKKKVVLLIPKKSLFVLKLKRFAWTVSGDSLN